MNTLLALTILGTIGTLILVQLKTILISKYGGSWYYYIWILVLISFCFPYKFDIFQQIQILLNNTGQTITTNLTMVTDDFIYSTLLSSEEFIQQGGMVSKQIFNKFIIVKILSTVYLIGVFSFSAYYVSSYLIFYKKLNKMTRVVTNAAYQKCLKKSCSDMKISKRLTLKESASLSSPMFIGIINPTIILPTKKIEISDLTLIFKHELTHYKRHDMLYKFFSLIVHIIHWFNPFSYLALSNINEACEYSCDEIVTKKMNKESKQQYGYMLLHQIQSRNSNESSLFSMNLLRPSKNKNVLERRLQVIMNNKRYKYIHITMYAILSLVIFSNFFTLQSIKAELLPLKSKQPQSITENPNTQLNTSSKFTKDAIDRINKYFSETITQNDLVAIYNFVDHSENSIDKGTRELTTAENDRLIILQDQYLYDGLRPDNTLPLTKGNSDFYFDINNDFYYYPERELTEEELLQLIDWRLKVNYALSLRHIQPNPIELSGNNMNEFEAIALASEYIETLFDVSISDFRISANFNKDDKIQPDGWFVRLSPNPSNSTAIGDWNYAVWINSLTEVVISRSSPTHQSMVLSEIDIDSYTKDLSWIERAKAIVKKAEKEPNKIKQAYYINTSDNNREKRTVDIQVDMENGNSYSISLSYPDKILKEITLLK